MNDVLYTSESKIITLVSDCTSQYKLSSRQKISDWHILYAKELI